MTQITQHLEAGRIVTERAAPPKYLHNHALAFDSTGFFKL
jgi:hypothetical protein